MNKKGAQGTVLLTLLALVSFLPSRQTAVTTALRNSEEGIPLTASSECISFGEDTKFQCQKEGYFVSRYAQIDQQFKHNAASWSNKKRKLECCRPDLPDSNDKEWQKYIENIKGIPEGTEPVAVISVGCHLSLNGDKSHMTCEDNDNSLVVGFGNSSKVKSKIGHPTGVLCCMPVLLLSTGDALKIELYNCKQRHGDYDCDAGQLLQGFSNADHEHGRNLPRGPVTCCSVRVTDSIFGIGQCDHLDGCNDHGVCVRGTCKCLPQWVGERCKDIKDGYFEPPELGSSVWWLGGLGFIGAFFCLFATFWIIRRAEQEGPRAANDRGLMGLISTYINDTGSAGTTDTESIRSHAGDDDADHRRSADDSGETKMGCTADNEAYRPLLQITCCLCEARPVQVTLIPCGHSNLCRKCSRKLTTCPFCRKTVVRRQRLFLSV